MPEPTSLRPHRPRRALLTLALALAPACGDDGDATGASAGDTSSSTGATTDATAIQGHNLLVDGGYTLH